MGRVTPRGEKQKVGTGVLEPEGFRLGYEPQSHCHFRVGSKIPISTSGFKPEEPIPL